jgi:hypothetical protein
MAAFKEAVKRRLGRKRECWRIAGNEMARSCPHCDGPLIEIDCYGDNLIGCVECNRWGHHWEDDLPMEMKEEDIIAVRGRVRPN